MQSEAGINSKFAFLFVFLLIACGETEELGNKLTAAERAALRARAAAKCISENTAEFNNYKNANLEELGDYEEGWYWPVTYNDNGANRSNSITVWKVDATAVYLRIFIDGNPDLNNYVRLTFAQNSQMIDDLLTAKCALTYDSDDNVNMGSTTATVTVDGDPLVSGNTQVENDYTFRFNTAYPAFIANYNNSQTTKTYDLDDVLTKTENFEYTIGTRTTVTLEATYNDPTIAGTIQYCVPSTTATVPFTLLCTQSAAAGPAGWAVPSADL